VLLQAAHFCQLRAAGSLFICILLQHKTALQRMHTYSNSGLEHGSRFAPFLVYIFLASDIARGGSVQPAGMYF